MTETAVASILLTGPTRGLGRAVLDEFARTRPEPDLLLLGRPPAVDEVAREARAAALPVDLADLAAVRAAGDAAAAQVADGQRPPFTTVVLNAGIQTVDRRHRGADGHELTFTVNVLAQHLLLARLWPALAPDAHVVLLGSGTHYGDWHSMGMIPPPRWEDPADLARAGVGDDADRPVAGQRAYSTSKLAVVLLAHAWQRRASERRVNVYDPGLMPGTGLARDMTPWRQWTWRNVMPVLTVLPGVATPARSARLLAGFALGESHPDLRGGYVSLSRATRSSPASYDEAREERLWEVAESLTAQPSVP
jgi:NAD(P)-dependent dehydrogenase (short-subunit alcohol dehydrogenase family)